MLLGEVAAGAQLAARVPATASVVLERSSRGYRKDRPHELLLLLLDELLLELFDELAAEAVPATTVIAMPIAPAPATTRVHVLVLGTAMVHLMFIGNPVGADQAPPRSVLTMMQA